MLCCDLIHGDLSPYNVLWGAEGPTIIDLPQTIAAAVNNRSFFYFQRDLENLRRFFEVDRYQVAWAALVGLNREGKFDDDKLVKARSALNIDPDKPLPTMV